MRLLVDENVSRPLVERLVAAGFDVTWIATAHSGASDQNVLEIAVREARILITEDRDFGKMIVRQQIDAPGVVLLELDRLSVAAEAEFAVRVLTKNAARLPGNFLVIQPGRFRIRPLAR